MTGQITPIQMDFLRLLTRTGFATNQHIDQMEIIKLKQSNSHLTKRLINSNYIGRVLISAEFGTGRKVMYYITKRGAKMVAESDNIDLSELVFTTYSGGIKKAHVDGEVSLVRTDFTHKERYISTFLAIERYLQKTTHLMGDFFHYYKTKGNNGTALALHGKNFKPDGILFCEPTNPKKPTFAYVIEVHRHSDRKHIIKQLLKHVEAMKFESFQQRFGHDDPYFVLSIFTDQNLSVMRSVIDELQTYDEWEYIERFFMFGKLDEILKDFYNGFAYYGGEKKPFPPKL